MNAEEKIAVDLALVLLIVALTLDALAAQIKSYLRFLRPGLPLAWLRKANEA